MGSAMSKIYIHATLKLRIGGYDRFCEAMSKQVKINEEQFGWKLLGGYVTLVGRVYTVNHIWELPDANTFFDSTGEWRKGPDYPSFRDACADTVEEEILAFCKKTPYSP
jgi:hypothetical protein